MARFSGKSSGATMPALVIDSSAIRNHLFKGWAVLNRVGALARTGRINLRIPWIVEKEVLSGIETHVDELTGQEAFLKSVRALAEMSSEPELLRALCDKFEAARPKICEEAKNRFRHWLESSQAEIVPLKHEHTLAVFDAYFSGNPPFDKPKNREHLPDAFIYNAVLDLASPSGEVWFLAGDELLRKAVSKIQGVRVYQNFYPLFADLRIPFDYEQQQAINHVFPDTQALTEAARVSLASELCGQVLRYGKAERSALPVIRGVQEVPELSLDKQSIMHVDDGALLISFEASVLLSAAERSVAAHEVVERLSNFVVSLRGHFLVKFEKSHDAGLTITTIELDDIEVGEVQRKVAGEVLRSIAPQPEVVLSHKKQFSEIVGRKRVGLVVVVGSTVRNRRLVAEHIVAAALQSHEIALLNFSPATAKHLAHLDCEDEATPFWTKAQDVEAHVLGLSNDDADWAVQAIHFLMENDCFIVATMKSANNRSAVVRYLAGLPNGKNNLQHLVAVAWIQEVTPERILFAISQYSSWGDGTWESVLERDDWLARSSKRDEEL